MQNDILIYTNFQSYTVQVKNGTSFPMSIQWKLMPYTKYGNSCAIQNMATRDVYKIWQLMPYTKYGNSCKNATSWLVYIGVSLNPLSHPWSSQVQLQQ